MIKMPESSNLRITVKLKNGEVFNNMDITSTPFGDHERIVSFWYQDSIRVYPLNDVEYYELKEHEPGE